MMGENGDMYCLEANTLPGMTPTSLLPQEAAAIGISYEQLCEKLIAISLKNKHFGKDCLSFPKRTGRKTFMKI